MAFLWQTASTMFRFGPLHGDDLALTVAAGGVVLVILELLKRLWRRQLRLWWIGGPGAGGGAIVHSVSENAPRVSSAERSTRRRWGQS